jgi:multicomponent Na+:H+ antiporter subunit D
VPDAYSAAPNPISVSLAGIITKAAGVYTLIRITFNVLGATPRAADILMILGLVSAAVGAFAAITQNDTKRMLAYSSVSQVGYIFLGVSTGTALGVIGGMFHLFNHAILKALLFLNASAIEKATGTRDLSRMGGLGARMPATGATFAIGSLSVAGVPPLNGFWSKLFILIALFQSGHTVVAFIALLVSIVTLGYFLVFQRKALFGKLDESLSHVREVSFGTYFPALVLAALAVFAGIFFSLVVDTLIEPAADAIMRGVIS